MEPEQKKIFFVEKCHQNVPWLKTNDKRTEMCAHVRCAPRTHWRTEQNQLIATFCEIQTLHGQAAAVGARFEEISQT